MASIWTQPNGRRIVQFIDAAGKRQTVRLGVASMQTAETFAKRIDLILTAQAVGATLDRETITWLGELDDTMSDRLSRTGLIPKREAQVRAEAPRLGAFIDQYINGRIDAKPSTVTVWKITRDNLIEHFGADRLLVEITKGDAERFRLFLIGKGLGPNTVARRLKFAGQFMRAAVDDGLIPANPFKGKGGMVRGNRERMYFVSRAETAAVLDACTDDEFRLIVALSRYGGLRCPSETLALRWEHVDFERHRLIVPSPKTEHHHGKDMRLVPIFPELLPYLTAALAAAPDGAEYVVSRYRDVTVNLRSRLTKTIIRAGLAPWPKLFHNMRSTRQTELCEIWPSHVVAKWLGNSEAVADEFYLQVTDEHFRRAAGLSVGAAKSAADRTRERTNGDPNPEARQKARQQVREQSRTDTHGGANGSPTDDVTPDDCGSLRDCAQVCVGQGLTSMDTMGLEPTTSALRTRRSPN